MRILPNIAKTSPCRIKFLKYLEFLMRKLRKQETIFFVFVKSNPRKKFINVRYKKYYLIFQVVDEENIGCFPGLLLIHWLQIR